MAMNDTGAKALGILLLLGALAQPAAASAGTTDTSVPPPKAPPVPTAQQLGTDSAGRKELSAALYQYIRDLHVAIESYRESRQAVDRLVADCRIAAEDEDLAGTVWEEAETLSRTQCQRYCRVAIRKQNEVGRLLMAELSEFGTRIDAVCGGMAARDASQQAVCARQRAHVADAVAELDGLAARYSKQCPTGASLNTTNGGEQPWR